MSETTVEPSSALADNPNLPADGGLSGLGLVMSLAGTLFLAITAGAATLMLITLMLTRGSLGGAGTILLFVFLTIVASLVRSAMHRAAGQRLLYDGPGTPRSAIRRYMIWSAVQCGIVLVMLGSQGVSASVIACILAMLAAWPVALGVMLGAARFSRLLDETIPVADDNGFEGASILMIVLGLSGLLFGVVMGIGLLDSIGLLVKYAPFVAFTMVGVSAMLVIRSWLHVRAGMRGVRDGQRDRTAAAALQYANVGVTIGVLVGIAIVVLTLSGGKLNGIGFFIAVLTASFVAWGLTAWPNIVKRFFAAREFADALANPSGEPITYRRAPDRGLTTLGWFLFAQAVMALAMTLPALLLKTKIADPDMYSSRDPMSEVMGALSYGRSPLWTIAVAALQLFTALQLIRMRPSYKTVATIYGITATIVAIYVHMPVLKSMLGVGLGGALRGAEDMMGSLVFVSVAISLVVPFATLILANRTPQSSIPAARAKLP